MPETIKAVIQRPGEISEIVSIENTIGEMNSIVGGASTAVTIPENGLKLVMNISSKILGHPTLKTLWGKIYGTVIVTAADNGKFISLTPEQIQAAREWLLKHTYEEEKQ